jgi:hypothetical protein
LCEESWRARPSAATVEDADALWERVYVCMILESRDDKAGTLMVMVMLMGGGRASHA